MGGEAWGQQSGRECGPSPTSANLLLPQAGLKPEPQRAIQMPTNKHDSKQRAVCVGITSPTGGLGAVESKTRGLEQMAFRKMALRGKRAIPYLPVPLPTAPVARTPPEALLGAGPHNQSPCSLARPPGWGPGGCVQCLDSWNGQNTSKSSKTLICS